MALPIRLRFQRPLKHYEGKYWRAEDQAGRRFSLRSTDDGLHNWPKWHVAVRTREGRKCAAEWYIEGPIGAESRVTLMNYRRARGGRSHNYAEALERAELFVLMQSGAV